MYHFEESTQYNPETQHGGIFTDYINTMLKLKQESSGWPAWVKTEEEKSKYLEDYAKHEGIKLDRDSIAKNPGLRYIAKLALNSLWGKFGQNSGKTQTTLFRSSEVGGFLKNLNDNTKKPVNFQILSEDVLLYEWAFATGFELANVNTNIFIACSTTSQARLRLYKALELVGSAALYADTDSIIYVKRPGAPEIPLGDRLGEFTDELDGDEISEFVTAGCKQYAYITKSGKSECKIRGFTLNYANSRIINFDSVKDLVFSPEGAKLETYGVNLVRDKYDMGIHNRKAVKKYRVVSDKRPICSETLSTVPFGY